MPHPNAWSLFSLEGLHFFIRDVHVVLVSLFGWPIVQSISHFFGSAKKNCAVSDTGHFFCPLSFLKIGHSLISRLDKKKIRDWTKYKFSALWDRTIFFCRTKKNEKLIGQLVGQETDQNHMDVTFLKRQLVLPIKIQIFTHQEMWSSG